MIMKHEDTKTLIKKAKGKGRRAKKILLYTKFFCASFSFRPSPLALSQRLSVKPAMTVFLLFLIILSSCKTQTKKEQEEPSIRIMEIIGSENISPDKLLTICKNKDLNASVYQWKNHLILYGIFNDITESDILKEYPETTIKTYKEPFYQFDRSMCDDQTTVDEWDHIIMTANLVEDPKMQQEYMDYHATQFEKWPEVAKGFCNANFQQLLVFKDGRQLMLIISIPKGTNLDELNPKTTENNPRVDEWNAIMSQYQEGIEGTEPGETWVVFQCANE